MRLSRNNRVAWAILAAALSGISYAVPAGAAVILSEDFGSASANPAADPFQVTTGISWDYSDNLGGGPGVSNNHRLFNPAGAGSQENTVGWISSLSTGRTATQIQTAQTFSSLPVLGTNEEYLFTLTFYSAGQTSTTNSVNGFVTFASAGNQLSFQSGANTNNTQTLTDSDVASDTVRLDFIAKGGTGGYGNQNRSFTATWTSPDALNGEGYTLTLGRGSDIGGSTFIFYDNVSLDVTVVAVPEPVNLTLLGVAALGLLRQRRRRVWS